MNDENLKKGKATQFKSGEEAVKNGRKGGQKSGESRRRKREIKATLQAIMDETFVDKNSGRELQGIDALATTLFKIATDPKHKQVIQAQRLFYELTGMDKTPEDKKRIKQALELQKKELELLDKKIENSDWS